jgi:hypothetical protein
MATRLDTMPFSSPTLTGSSLSSSIFPSGRAASAQQSEPRERLGAPGTAEPLKATCRFPHHARTCNC